MDFKRVIGFVAVIATCSLVATSMVQGKSGGKPDDSETWTIMVYVAADNDLEMYWEGASLEMLLNLPSTDSVTFVAYVDLLSTLGTQIIEIDGGEWQIIETLEEKNFADAETLEWALSDVATRFPSEYFAMIAWDHGSAWNGFCGDYTSDDWMYLDELYDAIVGAQVQIDIIGFDACAMASVETIYSAATTGLVDIVVGSEELVAGDGFPYDLMFAPLAEDSSRTPVEVATDMINGWEAYYSEITWGWYATLSAIDAGAIHDNVDVIGEWTEVMLDRLESYRYDYRMALRDCEWVSCISHYQVDMVDLGRHLISSPSIAGDTEFVEATENMMQCVSNAVIAMYNPEAKEDCGGVSMYWAYHNWEWRYYWLDYMTNVPFATETVWGDFLYEYNSLTCGWFPMK
ncbi:TPA: hypothetical protein HA259_06565 [Thermoplasmata archaeon]|nr:hypothetical protein [Thermoplasmata archaeon]